MNSYLININHDLSESDCLLASRFVDNQLVGLLEFSIHHKSASRKDCIDGIVLELVLTQQRLEKHLHKVGYHCRQSELA